MRWLYCFKNFFRLVLNNSQTRPLRRFGLRINQRIISMRNSLAKKLRRINTKFIVHSYWRNKPFWLPRFLWRWMFYLMFPQMK